MSPKKSVHVLESGVIKEYRSQKEFEGIECKSIEDKYEDIRNLFTRDRIPTKTKNIWNKQKVVQAFAVINQLVHQQPPT